MILTLVMHHSQVAVDSCVIILPFVLRLRNQVLYLGLAFQERFIGKLPLKPLDIDPDGLHLVILAQLSICGVNYSICEQLELMVSL